MAKISTTIELQDRVSQTFYDMANSAQSFTDDLNAVNNTGIDLNTHEIHSQVSGLITQLQDLETVQSSIQANAANMYIVPKDTRKEILALNGELQSAKAAMEQAISLDINTESSLLQLEAVQTAIDNIISKQSVLNEHINSSPFQTQSEPQSPEPIVQPVTWTSNDFDVFATSGVERYEQEIQSLNSYLQQLYGTQQQISQQAQRTDLFPDNMVADLTSLQGKVEAIRAKVQQIEQNPLNIGSEAANAQLEQLRSQLHQMINDQNDLNSAVENMDVSAANEAYQRLSDEVRQTETYIRDNVDEQGNFTNAIQESTNAANGLNSMIRKAVTALGGIAAIRKTISWVQGSLDSFDIQHNVETQLKTVLNNMGAVEGAFETLKDTAASIQLSGMYGDEAMLGGAAELATYMSDVEAIQSMMGTLADYAAGMTGGGEVATQEMVDLATQLGKAFNGTYDGLKKKGFELSDAQKAIIDGTATQAQIVQELGQEAVNQSADMQKALVLEDVIAESWDGLYESMSNTPEAKIQAMKNAWGDIQEEVGAKLYPQILKLFDSINSRMPQIRKVVLGFADALNVVINIVTKLIDAVLWVSSIIVDNWSIIAPIVYGIAAAMAVYTIALIANNIVQAINNKLRGEAGFFARAQAAATMLATESTFAETAAQYGFNAALLACPITWIILAIIAVIALIYVVIGVINQVCDTSISATGIIVGTIATIGAYLFNQIVFWWNIISAFIEFFVNVWKNPEYAIKAFIVNVVNAFLNFCMAIVQGNGAAIGVIVGAWYAFCQIVHNIVAIIYNAFCTVIEWIVNAWNQCVFAVQSVLYDIANAAFDVAEGAASAFDAAASAIANAFISAANVAIDAINLIISALNAVPGVNIGKVGKLSTVSYSGASNAVASVRSYLSAPSAPEAFTLNRMELGSIGDAYAMGNQAGQDFTAGFESTVADIQAGMQDWLGDKPEDYWEAPKLDYINLGDAAKAGYNFGAGIEDKLSDFGFPDMSDISDMQNTLNDISDNTGDGAGSGGDTADNTGKMADALDCTDEELKYLRDIAERDVINRFTTAELKVEFHNENNINSDLDIDGIVDEITERTKEELEAVAEGVYN